VVEPVGPTYDHQIAGRLPGTTQDPVPVGRDYLWLHSVAAFGRFQVPLPDVYLLYGPLFHIYFSTNEATGL
jgi:hypothetical protein